MASQTNPPHQEAQEMLTSKIRTSLITAVAALSILSLGPMTSVASALPRAHSQAWYCNLAKEAYKGDVESAYEAEERGDTADAEAWYQEAMAARRDYENKGCPGPIMTYPVVREGSVHRTNEKGPTGPLPTKKEEAPAPTKVEQPSTNVGRPSTPPMA
jgi:hypothetical protein